MRRDERLPEIDDALVERVRAASRTMVRELGLLQSTLASTQHPPSAVHALLEVGTRGPLTAVQLSESLDLEKSSVSRMLRKLVDAGELRESASADDKRAKLLALTPKGRRTVAKVHAFARAQVAAALGRLGEPQRHVVAQGIASYAQALGAQRRRVVDPSAAHVTIEAGHRPGALGRIVEMHACFYARDAGFGRFFESQVATSLAEFAGRLDTPRNGLWLASLAGRVVGSIAIDGGAPGGHGAHLRWFIVDDSVRGAGVGRRLLAEAIAFCDRQAFSSTALWTFRGLDTARRLYESGGFVLTRERTGTQWGEVVDEQQFVRKRPIAAR